MKKLSVMIEQDLGEGTVSRLPAARILEGDPVFTSWSSREGGISRGIWMSTPGAQTMDRDAHTWEHFHVLEGLVEICDEAGICRRLGPGDSASIPPGFKGVWRTIETVRKSFVTIVSPQLPAVLEG